MARGNEEIRVGERVKKAYRAKAEAVLAKAKKASGLSLGFVVHRKADVTVYENGQAWVTCRVLLDRAPVGVVLKKKAREAA